MTPLRATALARHIREATPWQYRGWALARWAREAAAVGLGAAGVYALLLLT